MIAAWRDPAAAAASEQDSPTAERHALDVEGFAALGCEECQRILDGDPILADGEWGQHDDDYADYARDEADAARYPDRDYGDDEQAWLDERDDRDR